MPDDQTTAKPAPTYDPADPEPLRDGLMRGFYAARGYPPVLLDGLKRDASPEERAKAWDYLEARVHKGMKALGLPLPPKGEKK